MTGAAVGIPGDESALVARLDLEQKVRLLTGRDSWVLHDAAEIGLRHVVMSAGPSDMTTWRRPISAASCRTHESRPVRRRTFCSRSSRATRADSSPGIPTAAPVIDCLLVH